MSSSTSEPFPSRPRIAIIGSGAMGCYYGARLAQHGHEVNFLMRADLAHVREHGLQLKSCAGDFSLPQVQAYGSTAEIGLCDLILIAIKTTANADLASLLPPLLHPGTVIVTLQNGLGNEALLASLHRPDQVLGGVCFVCINRMGPGVIDHISDGDVALGEFIGPSRPRTERISGMLNACLIPSRVEPSLAVVRWKKLVWNIPFNGLAISAGGVTTADILGDPVLAAKARVLAGEAVAAAAALGLDLPEGWADYHRSRTPAMGPDRPSSMIDYVENRPVEVEAIWGVPVRQALAAGAHIPRMVGLYQDILTAVAGRQEHV
jgi:2-dehydropantoate 2-reductase